VFPHGTLGGAIILLSGKGWWEGATVVSILAHCILIYLGMALLINAKLPWLSQVEAIHNLSILYDIYVKHAVTVHHSELYIYSSHFVSSTNILVNLAVLGSFMFADIFKLGFSNT
jgi:hypothetical protein